MHTPRYGRRSYEFARAPINFAETPQRALTLVQNDLVGGRAYRLPQPWENAIHGWLTWLKLGGTAANTIRLRREHVRSIAKRSQLHHPRMLGIECLFDLCGERDWSNEYRRSMRGSLISFCEWCRSNGLMDDNPAMQLPTVAGDKPRPRPAPDDIWRDLMAAAPPRTRLMARLAGEAGLRRAEIAQVRAEDLIADRRSWSLIVHGKGGKQRVVPLTDSLATEVRAYHPRGYLFPGQINGHVSPRWVGTLISQLMPPGWTTHKLRHRFASRGYAGTRDLFAVKEALGHASIATTQIYVAITRDDVRAVSEAAGDDE